jgi:hypothetical protein
MRDKGGFANFTLNAATTYNFANDDRAPLLFIAGGNDHILPPAVRRENFEKNAKHSRAITAYRGFHRPQSLHVRRERLGGGRRLRP